MRLTSHIYSFIKWVSRCINFVYVWLFGFTVEKPNKKLLSFSLSLRLQFAAWNFSLKIMKCKYSIFIELIAHQNALKVFSSFVGSFKLPIFVDVWQRIYKHFVNYGPFHLFSNNCSFASHFVLIYFIYCVYVPLLFIYF